LTHPARVALIRFTTSGIRVAPPRPTMSRILALTALRAFFFGVELFPDPLQSRFARARVSKSRR
jgi:hypothetical protein